MYAGSMYGAGIHVFALWGYCIANAEPETNTVRLNPDMLAATLGTDTDTVNKAIDFLTSPDPNSSCKEHEGRRLVNISGFDYLVVSHKKYRGIKSSKDRAEYMKNYMREKRKKEKSVNSVNNVKVNNTMLRHTDASVFASESVPSRKVFKKPTPKQVEEYAESIDYNIDGESFVDFYESKGWKIGKNAMKDWKAAVRTWKKRDNDDGNTATKPKRKDPVIEFNRVLNELILSANRAIINGSDMKRFWNSAWDKFKDVPKYENIHVVTAAKRKVKS